MARAAAHRAHWSSTHIPSTQDREADALPLRASLGMDYTRPFNIAANAHTIAVLKEGHGSSGGQPTTLEFHSQPFDTGP